MTDLPAGRELDALVHAVLGRKEIEPKPGHYFRQWVASWNYSTNTADAIEALEAWRSKSPEHTWVIRRHPIGFTVELDCIIATLRKSAPTLALAAARALAATAQ